jgi:hypothetical protein
MIENRNEQECIHGPEHQKTMYSPHEQLVNDTLCHVYTGDYPEMRSEGPISPLGQNSLFDHLLRLLLTDRIMIGVLVGLFVIVVAVRYVRSPWRSVPPGPRGFPVLGNALQLRDKTWMFGRDCKDAFRVL